jgi:hypothetical protein
MKRIQLSSVTAKVLRDALKSGDEDIVIVDGDEPLVRLVSVAVELKARGNFFSHYPHDAAACFSTCWRHNGSGEQDAEPDEASSIEQPALAG